MKEIAREIMNIVAVFLIVGLALFGLFQIVNETDEAKKDCIEKYSGKLSGGNCYYIEDGNSQIVKYKSGKEVVKLGESEQ